ncbi:MAG: acetylglutamate kinase [Alphaproteobacteria bacterium]|nr:acetylglutamate kinase [Alphaproteobacteria bacterium]
MTERQPNIDPSWLEKAHTLAEALPFMNKHAGSTFVIKYGGNAMGDETSSRDFARDVVLLKQVGINPVVVHGGGPQISSMLDRLKIRSSYVDGLRVTDEETVGIVEMVLSGSINKQVVTAINAEGGCGIGLSGKDGGLIKARKLRRTQRDPGSNIEKILDLGFVGEPLTITTGVIEPLLESNMIPVIAPIGVGANGETYNINADTVAGAVAAALDAERLLLLTDVPGVLDKDSELIDEMSIGDARTLIETEVATGGMIPKIETCIHAVEGGVEAAVILDGRVPHVILLETFTPPGAGTLIRDNDR